MLDWPEKLLFAAALAQLALIFGLMIWLGFIRVPLVTSGKVRIKDVALSKEAWPQQAKQVSNAVDNQFQLPLLFYAVVLLLLWSGITDWPEVILAWVFVALRFAHAFIHTTANRVDQRFFIYAAGFFVLMTLWIVVALRLFLYSGPV
ncbi:MAG: MAPEG family protein [Devosia sp.]